MTKESATDIYSRLLAHWREILGKDAVVADPKNMVMALGYAMKRCPCKAFPFGKRVKIGELTTKNSKVRCEITLYRPVDESVKTIYAVHVPKCQEEMCNGYCIFEAMNRYKKVN